MALPFLNVTMPVGLPPAGAVGVTVAVKVTIWLYTDGLASEESTVALAACVTVCGSMDEVLEVKLGLPPYTAVRSCEPRASSAVVNVATPDPLSAWVPIVVPPSLNVTVPSGTPAPGAVAVTVAVSTTGWPASAGFGVEAERGCRRLGHRLLQSVAARAVRRRAAVLREHGAGSPRSARWSSRSPRRLTVTVTGVPKVHAVNAELDRAAIRHRGDWSR